MVLFTPDNRFRVRLFTIGLTREQIVTLWSPSLVFVMSMDAAVESAAGQPIVA